MLKPVSLHIPSATMLSSHRIRRAGFHYFIFSLFHFFIISFFTETMTKKEITINGKQYPVIFDMQTIMNFEEVTSGKSFFTENLMTLKNRIALIIAAVTAADENTQLEVKDITGNHSMAEVQQIIAAYAVIDSLAAEFFKIPEIEKKNNPEPPAEETESEDKPKN